MAQKVVTTKDAENASRNQQNVNRDNDPVYTELVTCKVKLLIENPFFGLFLVRMDLVEVDWCKTATTDGRRFYYNREFIKSLSRAKLIFFMAHQVLHCAFDHLGRRGSREKALWDMATDYIINATLVKERLGEMPDGGLLDPAFTYDMSADDIYDILKKNCVTIKLPLDEHLELEGDDDEEEEAGGSGEDDEDGDGDGDGEGNSTTVTVVGKNGPPKLSKSEIDKIRAEMKSALLQTAQQVGAGKVPLGVQRMLNELTQPKLDWRTLLDAHFRSALKDDYTFQRIGRRTWGGGGAIMPAQNFMDRVEVVCAIDASGSTSQSMVTDFLSEVLGIMESFRDFKVTLFCFDTEVYNQVEITPDNFDEVYNYRLKGGGGTMFEEVFEYMKREDIEPHRLAFFTDGYPNAGWGDPDYCDTIFIIHGNDKIVAPFGITCHYEPKQY
jgi:predicted metal-dependent peptidase